MQEDVDFLVGRGEETTELCTALEASDHGFLFISGVPGVGKTSFFNVTQFLLESSQAPFGRHLMCARRLCPIHPGASATSVARSALANLIKSVEDYCRLANRPIPNETQKLSKWIGDVGSGGYQIGHHGSARASEFKKFGLKSAQDFSSNLLSKFFKLNLLHRTQEGRSVVYKLRGMSALASEYSLLAD